MATETNNTKNSSQMADDKGTKPKPATTKPATAKATATKPATAKATATKPATAKATATKPATAKATATKPATAKATSPKTVAQNSNDAKSTASLIKPLDPQGAETVKEATIITASIPEPVENNSASKTQTLENSSKPTSDKTKANVGTTEKTTHNQEICDMFGNISKHYDLLNHVLSLGIDYCWRHQLINSIIPGPKTKVLDMAAGTLDVSLAILRKYPQAHVIAGDICEPMLKHGENKIRSIEKDRIECQVMDAQEIPHGSETFDAVTIAFGIRNVEDRIKALKEMNRVLVSGGQLCILEFSPLTTPYIKTAYYWYLENVMPKIAKLFGEKEDAYQYLAKTIQEFPLPEDFYNEIKEAGFKFIRRKKLTFGIVNLYVAIKT